MSHVKMDCPSLAIAHKRERAARAVVLPEAASSADIFPPSAYPHALSLKEIPDCLHRPPLAIETVFLFFFTWTKGTLQASWLVPAYGAARGMRFSALCRNLE